MVSLGWGQDGAVPPPRLPVPTVGLGVSRGSLWGTGLPAGWGGVPARPHRAEVLGVPVMLQQRGAQKNPTASVCQLMGGQGGTYPWGGGTNLVMVAGSSCGTGRCLGLIRALGPPGFAGSVATGGASRALRWLRQQIPAPARQCWGAANKPPRGTPGRVAGLPRAAWGLAPAVSPPSGSSCPPFQVGWHCPAAARGRGGRFPLRSASRASPELSVAACPAPPALPPRGRV